jgi:hypothetical protein
MEKERNNRYSTLTEAVADLQRQGYTDELQLTDDGFISGGKSLHPEDFRIDAFHRFEGPSDPADMSIVYAVSSEKLKLKGLLVNGFGTSASRVVQRMVNDLDAHHHKGRVQPVEAAVPGENIKV